ncbi:MAG: HlyU family transcriptional regulator, partial [Paracoccaceae bacterium]|nr:HlyU family transcriptional regulator [Paracoccaceae bacterium]
GPKQAASETHEGFTIMPTPAKEAHGFRIAATIEKDGQTHQMIRADTYASLEVASEASISKAKQMIDQQGDRIFN